jgi:signal transduction histidine kinase
MSCGTVEALANVTKHAGARSVKIVLSHAAGMLRAEVTDDGAGFRDGPTPPSGPAWPEWSAGWRRLMASWR